MVRLRKGKVRNDYCLSRESVRDLRGYALHWALIEPFWHDFWAARRKQKVNKSALDKFFKKLTRGQKSLLLIDVFQKQMHHHGGIKPFLTFDGFLLDPIMEAFSCIEAEPHVNMLQELRARLPLGPIPVDLKTRYKYLRQMPWPWESGYAMVEECDRRFVELRRDRRHSVHQYVRRYVKNHPEEFLRDENIQNTRNTAKARSKNIKSTRCRRV